MHRLVRVTVCIGKSDHIGTDLIPKRLVIFGSVILALSEVTEAGFVQTITRLHLIILQESILQ